VNQRTLLKRFKTGSDDVFGVQVDVSKTFVAAHMYGYQIIMLDWKEVINMLIFTIICFFFCQEYTGKKHFLVTQYPLEDTVVDFWSCSSSHVQLSNNYARLERS
jgi:hypothetical protein